MKKTYQAFATNAVGSILLPAGSTEREPSLVSVDEVEAMRHALVLTRDATRTVRILCKLQYTKVHIFVSFNLQNFRYTILNLCIYKI